MQKKSVPPLKSLSGDALSPKEKADSTFPHRVLNALLRFSPAPAFVVDREGRYLYVSESGARASGRSAEEMVGRTNRELGFGQEASKAIDAHTEQVFRTGQIVTGAASVPTASGSCMYEHTFSPILDDAGEVIAMLCMARDVTERQQAFEILRERDQRMQMALEAAHMGTFETDLRSGEVHLPPATRVLMGLPPNLPLPDADSACMHVHPHDLPGLKKTIQNAIETGEDYTAEHRILVPDGEVRWLASRGRIKRDALNRPQWLMGVIWDITERKRIQEEQNYIMSGARCLLWYADVFETGGDLLFWNIHIPNVQALQRFLPLDMSASETYARAWYRARYREDREASDRQGTACVRAGKSYAQEFRCVGADGVIRWIHEDVQVETVEPGKQWRTVAVCTEVTDRVLGEESLRNSEHRLKSALEAGNMGIWELDLRNDAISFSEEALHLFGLNQATFSGTIEDAENYVHPADREDMHVALWNAIENHLPYEREYRILHADGDIRWLHSKGAVFYDEAKRPVRVLGTLMDTTEQKRLQTQFMMAHKMEGLGKLAGGIAHDFNNLLSVILGYAEFVQSEMASDHPLQASIAIIQSAADRARKLTDQLLAFARQQPSVPEVVQPNALIAGMESLLKPLIREDIQLVTVLKEATGSFIADPGQIEQVIVNLVVNARDAIPGRGKVVIQTENVMLTDRYDQTAVVPGPYVMIAVSDTGAGMSEEVQRRLFEPFFTTKGVGKGTGLGLSTVYSILKQSGGHIFVYSEAGIGTTFKMYLPRVDDVAGEVDNGVQTTTPARGAETVLVVEDEPLLRELTVSTLQRNGYHVLQAENGVAALGVAQEFGDEIHLLVTDAIMPEMGGKELADRLREIRPSMRVLYASGYTEDVTLMQGVAPGGTAFLQKPFASYALLSMVRQALS